MGFLGRLSVCVYVCVCVCVRACVRACVREREREREADRQAGRQAGKQAYRQADRQTEGVLKSQSYTLRATTYWSLPPHLAPPHIHSPPPPTSPLPPSLSPIAQLLSPSTARHPLPSTASRYMLLRGSLSLLQKQESVMESPDWHVSMFEIPRRKLVWMY